MRDKNGRFISGHKQSNTGKTHFKKGHPAPKTAFIVGFVPWNRGKKSPKISGKNHFNWKGGISKIKGYKLFFQKQYSYRKRNAIGKHTREEWENLKKQYGFMCACCKKMEPEIELTEDHIIPLSKEGNNLIENIQPLCRSCNGRKFNKTIKY